MDDYQTSNLRLAKELSYVILSDLEINQLPISQILMKAKRLARMLHDSDAQKWLDYEIMGYPVVFDPGELGSCKKYYTSERPVIRDEKTHRPHSIGLPHLESYINSTKIESVTKIGANESQKMQILNKHHELVNDFERLKTTIHNYITEVNISLSVGDFAEDIFEDTRLAADRFIRENCPRAGEQLLAINERMKYYDPESFSQALHAVQKILVIVADTVLPVGEKIYLDKKGHERSIESHQYLNRIFSYIEQNSRNDPVLFMIESEMAYIFTKSDHAPEKTKGLHERIAKEDVELAIIHMYLIIAEIAKIKKVETIYLKTLPSENYTPNSKNSPNLE
ncbi:MAG TPA: hypothetical protein VFC43_04480 [Methanoregula sp.]|nr:hypothetical protein [Methanoregula sp.]